MYASIRNWINLPAVLKSYTAQSGTGRKIFAPDLSILCYAEGKVQVVKDNKGAEVVSNRTFYVSGEISVKPLDVILFENQEWPVVAVNTFYLNGQPDIRMVYA